MKALLTHAVTFEFILLFILCSCSSGPPPNAELSEKLRELRQTFPIKRGTTENVLPSSSAEFPQQGFVLVRANPVQPERPQYVSFFVTGKQNGMCRVYLSRGTVSRVDFAWGTRSTGLVSDFVRLY